MTEHELLSLIDRIRAIPVIVRGPEDHPDQRVAALCVRAAEAMRDECMRIVEEALESEMP